MVIGLFSITSIFSEKGIFKLSETNKEIPIIHIITTIINTFLKSNLEPSFRNKGIKKIESKEFHIIENIKSPTVELLIPAIIMA